jgi:ubiquinone/menaquinone biosynthesis C-methylase UbiE
MSERKDIKDPQHQHRGKSSESIVDKNEILTNLAIMAGQIILDAGCGNGYMAKEFARLTGKTGKVYALDTDAVSIEGLRSEAKGANIEAFVGDITKETKLAAGCIDLIYVCTVVHGFSQTQMEGFLKEVKRLLKSGGRLAIVEIKKEEAGFGPPVDIRFSPEELKQTIGLRPVRLSGIGQFFYMQMFAK